MRTRRPERLDVLALHNQGPARVDAVLGKPFAVERIDRYPEQMPGEIRTYSLAGDRVADVRFYRGKVAEVVLSLGDAASSLTEALALVGLDERDMSLVFETPSGSPSGVRRYKGTVRSAAVKPPPLATASASDHVTPRYITPITRCTRGRSCPSRRRFRAARGRVLRRRGGAAGR